MLNRSASLAMSTRVLKALPGKLDIKRHSPSILFSLLLSLFVGFSAWSLIGHATPSVPLSFTIISLRKRERVAF